MLIFVGKNSDPRAVEFLCVLRRLGAQTRELTGERMCATKDMIAVFLHPLSVYKGKHMRTGTPQELRDRGFEIPYWAVGARYCIALNGKRAAPRLSEEERLKRLEDACKVARYKLTGVKPVRSADAHKHRSGRKARLYRERVSAGAAT